MSFVHLHSHTSYSLLDGAGRIEKMVAEAKRLGMDALAITDHGNMFGTLDFYTQAKKQGIKPIIGCEAYVAPAARTLHRSVENESYSYHLVLLAKNETGFRNLIKLTSASYLEGFYYRPRIDKELLQQYSEGLVVLSACMKGEIAYKLRRGRKDEAIKTAEFLLETFGDDFYFEIQDHQIPEEHATYPLVYDLARDMGVPVVATNDVHYLHKKDSAAHDILLCLQTGKDRDDPDRMRYNTQELYLKSPEEMYKLFKDRPDVVERTLEVAEKINLEIDFNQRLLPEFPIPESEGTRDADEYLEKLSRRGLEKKMKNINSDVMKRLEYELSVIRKMGFAGYFLIVQDFIDAARQKDIPVGLGRGSAAGSLVAYTLGITDVDPIKYDLLFERFLNPERVTMPDIDVDFCYERRDEVIEYVREKYGRRNVAQIITFGTMLSRGVIRDVSRVLKIPIPKADQIAKQIPVKQGKPMRLEEAFDTIPELKEMAESDDAQIRELMEYSMTLEGISRHTSVHAAGVIIAPDDITNYVPLSTDSDKNITTQWTMGGCESIGLLKMDFLGLRNLTVIHNTEKMIRKKHDPDFSIENISMEDEKTFELFGEGNTVGVFQFESSGMQEYLRKLKPNRIEDLLAMNALYRPGPMDMIDDFIDRKKGRKEIVYLHPKLEPILKETYGIIVYQEQVMRISSDLGGFSLAEADSMRRIMGKKKIEAMVEQKQKLIAGCVANGIDKKVASEIADMIEKFASYGFNKSHSAAYAIIAYQTAYLKSNYPAEFMSANLSSFMSTPDKVVIMLDECRRMGLEVVPPDVNYSGRRFEPIDDTHIAFGMEAIKNVGGNAIESIVAGRELVGGKY
jgi:DNA polymerase-3 subunit alpha